MDITQLTDNFWIVDGKLSGSLGARISDIIVEMCQMATDSGQPITIDNLNGVNVTAQPGDNPDELYAKWGSGMDANAAAYRASPEYAETQRKWAEKEAQKRAEYEDLIALAPTEPAWTDRAIWQTWVDANTDSYWAATIHYAHTWARLMESAVAAGETVAECADRLSHVANQDGITGAMHGFAVSMLVQAWVHGPALAASRTAERARYGTPAPTDSTSA